MGDGGRVQQPTQGLPQKGESAMGFWPLVHRPEMFDPDIAKAEGSLADQRNTSRRLARGQTPGMGASQEPAHEGFKKNPFNSWVPGRVEEPDDAHPAKAQITYTLTTAQVEKLMGYVDSKRPSNYSLYFFNCATFAVEAAKAAGQSPPSGKSFGAVCLPNGVYKGILAEKLGGNRKAKTSRLGTVEDTKGNQVRERHPPRK